MKKTMIILLVLVCTQMFGIQGKIGAGFFIGNDAGLNVSFNNIALKASWNLGDNEHIALKGDYLFKKGRISKDLPVKYYYGVGAYFGSVKADALLGIRLPLALRYPTTNNKFEFYLEIAPEFSLIPETDLDFAPALVFITTFNP